MILRNFLKMHEDCGICVSIHQMPYDYTNHGYKKTYFEEEGQSDILETSLFKEIERKKVDHFSIVGGGDYKVELCIYLAEEDD